MRDMTVRDEISLDNTKPREWQRLPHTINRTGEACIPDVGMPLFRVEGRMNEHCESDPGGLGIWLYL